MMLQVNGQRLIRWLHELSQIGRTASGGVTRFALTPADRQARQWLIDRAAEYGLEHRFDAVGNLFIRRPDAPSGPVIVAGSHVDTVPEGGRYDGALGVLSALESLVRLQEEAIPTKHSVEVVVWTEEEGTRFKSGLVGSRAFIGEVSQEELQAIDEQGNSLADALRDWGLSPQQALTLAADRPEVAAYLELHIEQGGILEQEELHIGVVSGIVGIRRYDVSVIGQANHAGTTPMPLRHDALVGAAEMVLLVPSELQAMDFPQAVSTVGKLEVHPGGVNVVPGRVDFTLEVRDQETQVMDQISERMLKKFAEIADRRGLQLKWQQTADVQPAPLDPAMRQAVRQAAQELGYRWRDMPSGAGHDAQHLAQICPTAMVFVPSQNGISHSPAEFTADEDCVRGANVLLNAILRADIR
jgi:allantoate deiminase